MTHTNSAARMAGVLGAMAPRRAMTGVLVLITAALTAYYTTVSGIELSLSEKADRSVVDDIQQRLITIETLLRTDVAHRGDFTDLQDEVQRRLTRIETLLEREAGRQTGRQTASPATEGTRFRDGDQR